VKVFAAVQGAGRAANMITREDCIGLCGLTEEEVLAIAEHEQLPEIAATALGQYLLSLEHGSERVRDIIVDDIRRRSSAVVTRNIY
jgi:hypothetical protein